MHSRTLPCLRVVTIPARSRIRSCASADGSVMPSGSASFESDIVPSRANRAIIRRLTGTPSAVNINRVFLRTSPEEYVRARSAFCLAFCNARTSARCLRSRILRKRFSFQYLVTNLSIGIMMRATSAGVEGATRNCPALYFRYESSRGGSRVRAMRRCRG